MINNSLIPFEDNQLHSSASELSYDSEAKLFTVASSAGQRNTKIYTIVVEISKGEDDNASFQPITDYRFAIVVGSDCDRDEIVAISSDNVQYAYPIGYDATKPNK
jgi:hypothetical protein